MTASRVGTGLVMLSAAAVALGGLFVLAVPVDGAAFANATGVDWEAFATEQPSVAEHIRREGQLLGLSNVALGLIALALTWVAIRSGERVARRLIWILPVFLVAVVAVVAGSGPGIAVFYAVLAVAAAIGLLLLERSPAPPA